MSDERMRLASPSEKTERVDVPGPRAQPGSVAIGEPTYSEKQVAQILQRAAQLERGRAQQRPELSLAEVEEIAREAGLDPSLIKIAAQSLVSPSDEPSLGARIAGAPVRRVFERVIDGELTQALHERINGDILQVDPLRSALRAEQPHGSPQISSVGRDLTLSARTPAGSIELELTPRGDRTLLRIHASCEHLAGAIFGAMGGGLGGGTTAIILGVWASENLPAPAIVAIGAAWITAVYFGTRSFFAWRANALYARMDKLADQLAERVRLELAQNKNS